MPNSGLDPQALHELLARREFSKADPHILQGLEENPKHPEFHYLLGVSRYFQGKVLQAVESLKRALSLDPKHTDAAICLSVVFNDIGKYDEAKHIFEQASQSLVHQEPDSETKVDKKFAAKHMELGDLYFRYARYESSIEEYQRAASLDPSRLELRVRTAKTYAKKGFSSRAIQELQQLKNDEPAYLAARMQLGSLLFSQGNVLDAELEWESILSIEPDHKEARAHLEMAKQSRL